MAGELLRVFIVDDEAPARKKLLHFLESESGIFVAGESGNGRDAVRAIAAAKPHLLFLDIQMPEMDGFEVIEALGEDAPPQIVFVTAHDEYAIRAFEVHAFAYLLKPFDQARFAKVLADARRHLFNTPAADTQAPLRNLLEELRRRDTHPARMLIQQNERGFFLSLDKVDWAEAERNYVVLHVGSETYTIRGTLEKLQEKLDPSHFLRLNRSCLVRLDFIRELQKWSHGEYRVVLASGQTITWTRRYVKQNLEFLEKL